MAARCYRRYQWSGTMHDIIGRFMTYEDKLPAIIEYRLLDEAFDKQTQDHFFALWKESEGYQVTFHALHGVLDALGPLRYAKLCRKYQTIRQYRNLYLLCNNSWHKSASSKLEWQNKKRMKITSSHIHWASCLQKSLVLNFRKNRLSWERSGRLRLPSHLLATSPTVAHLGRRENPCLRASLLDSTNYR